MSTAPARLRTVSLCGLAAWVALCACTSSAPVSPLAASAPTPQARPGPKVVTVGIRVPINAFAAMNQSTNSSSIANWMELYANGLVTSDAGGRPIPQIARELPSLEKGTLTLLPDGRMTTKWALRDDVFWHDGAPFTADDIVLGAKIHSDLRLPVWDRSASANFEAAEALDAHTVVITWKQPHFLADSLGIKTLWPMPVHLLATDYNAGDPERFMNLPYWTAEYVHTGPFRLGGYEPGVSAMFEAYDRYFLGRPKLDRVVFNVMPEYTSLYAAVIAGAIDLTIGVLDGPDAFALMEQWGTSKEGTIYHTPGPVQFFRVQFAPEFVSPKELLDRKIRQALNLSLDRAGLAQLYAGRDAPELEAKALLPSGDPLFPYVSDVFASSAGDPQRALQVFSEAGWTRGADGMLVNAEGRHFVVEVRSSDEKRATVAASGWKQIGVDTSVTVVTPAMQQNRELIQTFAGLENSSAGDGDRMLQTVNAPDMPLRQNGFAGNNRGHYDNPAMTELVSRYKSTLRMGERGQILRQIAEMIREDVPIMMAFYPSQIATVASSVQALEDMSGGYSVGGYYGGYVRNAYLWDRS